MKTTNLSFQIFKAVAATVAIVIMCGLSVQPARANYIVKSGTLERTTKDGKKTVYERKAGTSVWLEADSDVVKNIGKTTFVVVSVTPK